MGLAVVRLWGSLLVEHPISGCGHHLGMIGSVVWSCSGDAQGLQCPQSPCSGQRSTLGAVPAARHGPTAIYSYNR